jgi:hypothetical protein
MHDNALTKEGAALFPLFSRFKQFYLVGGTALALQIGHRRSVDFDLFTREPLSSRLREQVRRVFSSQKAVLTYRSPEQFNFEINGVKTTFFFFNYPVIEPFVSYRGVSLAGVREIAAMKALAVGKRLSHKDYVDWYFLLRERRVTLPEVIALSEKKFGGDFNDRLFLGQLASLSDVPTQEIDFLEDAVKKALVQLSIQ